MTEVEQRGNRTWFAAHQAFAWERRFSKADIKRFGELKPPDGAILAVRVDDLVEKQAVLARGLEALFAIPHPLRWPSLDPDSAEEGWPPCAPNAIVDGWLACAPASLVEGLLVR